MNVFIPVIISMTISCTICICDYNSTVWFNKRRMKEIKVLRQIINQETLIRLAVVKDVKAVKDDVSSVKRSVASTKTTVTMVQQTIETLKRQVATKCRDDNLAQIMETLKKRIDKLSQNSILEQTVETLKRQVAILRENDTIAQKMKILERRIDALSQNNTVYQTVETLKKEIDFLRNDKTLQNSIESLKRDIDIQRKEDRSTIKNCQKRFQELHQKFKILNENITDIYQHLNKTTEEPTLEKGSKLNRDCKDLYINGQSQSGVYDINAFGNETMVSVFCDMVTEGGGWTAIQKRLNDSMSFKKKWTEYKKGFGNHNDSYWIGNDVIHQLTKGRNSSLYVSITLRNGSTLHEIYRQFSVSNEDNRYQLFLGGPATGNLGDSMLKSDWSFGNLSGMSFSTFDRDYDRGKGFNCAAHYGGGWWFNTCYRGFLNGPLSSSQSLWYPTFNNGRNIIGTLMMIKPH